MRAVGARLGLANKGSRRSKEAGRLASPLHFAAHIFAVNGAGLTSGERGTRPVPGCAAHCLGARSSERASRSLLLALLDQAAQRMYAMCGCMVAAGGLADLLLKRDSGVALPTRPTVLC